MCTWVWRHPLEHRKPTSRNILKTEFFSLPWQLATDSSSVRSGGWRMLSMRILTDCVLGLVQGPRCCVCMYVIAVSCTEDKNLLFFSSSSAFAFFIPHLPWHYPWALVCGGNTSKVLGRLLRKRKHQWSHQHWTLHVIL